MKRMSSRVDVDLESIKIIKKVRCSQTATAAKLIIISAVSEVKQDSATSRCSRPANREHAIDIWNFHRQVVMK